MFADVIFTHGRIYTADRSNPWASHLAIAQGKIMGVGDAQIVAKYQGPNTQIHDLVGAFLMPGVVDGHNHPALAGRTALFELSLSAEDGVDDLLEAISAYAESKIADSWIVGSGWSIGLLEQVNSAHVLARLDEATGGRPTVLVDNSRHNRWANSAAMAAAGIGESEGVLRDENGILTGVLLERAGLPVAYAAASQAPLSDEQEQQAYRHSLDLLHSFGITSFQDAGATPEVLRALHGLDRAGQLNAWVVSSLLMNDEVLGAQVIGEPLLDQAEAYRSEHHRPDFVKIFLDGVPPARTAAMLEPYLPDAHHGCGFHGSTILSPQELIEVLRVSAGRGLGAKIHSTGDATTRLILDTVEQLQGEGVTFACQIAHGQYVAPEDIPRFTQLGVSADISPYIWYPGPLSESIKLSLPTEKAEHIHPNRDLTDAGVLISAGSDWPVSPAPNPFHALAGLVTRKDPTGEFPGSTWPEQALTLEESLEVFTVNGARMLGIDDVTGSLRAGLSADFVVLNADPFELLPEDLGTLQAQETWFAGSRVFQRQEG